jgi:erythromycin esterase
VREPGNEAARRWARTPAITRLIGPRYDTRRNAEFCMSGTPFGDWFDAILYVRDITPTRPLDERRGG